MILPSFAHRDSVLKAQGKLLMKNAESGDSSNRDMKARKDL